MEFVVGFDVEHVHDDLVQPGATPGGHGGLGVGGAEWLGTHLGLPEPRPRRHAGLSAATYQGKWH